MIFVLCIAVLTIGVSRAAPPAIDFTKLTALNEEQPRWYLDMLKNAWNMTPTEINAHAPLGQAASTW